MQGRKCIAGRLWPPDGRPGPWVRPVSDGDNRGVPDYSSQYVSGGQPRLLDVVDVPVKRPVPEDHQQENWLIDTRRPWSKVGELSKSELPKLLDEPQTLWVNGYSSSTGTNNKVPASDASSLATSLNLIKVNLSLSVLDYYGERKVEGHFWHNGTPYSMRVTDPDCEDGYKQRAFGIYPRGEAYVTVSLAGLYKDGFAYKLIAAIMNPIQCQVFTIGHSNHSTDTFLKLLRRHLIDEVMDVRSSPFSRYSPHFNFEFLRDTLEGAGIDYQFRGDELGGRPADRSCYGEDGQVQYDLVADWFDDGIRGAMRAAGERRVVLMCSEKDPLDCHRTLLIARELEERGVTVRHIMADGSVEGHQDAMTRLMESHGLPPNGDMIDSRRAIMAVALKRNAGELAYVAKEVTRAGSWEHAY